MGKTWQMSSVAVHFKRSEFDCHDGTHAKPSPELLSALENLRRLCGGRPIEILSGYRSPQWNKRVGGAPNSQHLHNRAADIRPGVATVDQARAAGFTGIGYCGDWVVHVDVRPGPLVVFSDC